MVDMSQRVHAEGVQQPLTVALQRADYLAHWDPDQKTMELKQVLHRVV